MRGDVHGAQLVDEVFGVIALVSAKCDADRPLSARLDHDQRRVAFTMSVCMREAGFNHQAVPVSHQGMAHITELGLLALALAVEAGIGIGDRGMRFVGTLVPVKVHFGIAARLRSSSLAQSCGR